MRILLDTQALILAGQNALPIRSKKEFLNPANEIFFSTVSLWEMAIKKLLGKLEFKSDFITYTDLLIKEGLQLLPFAPNHIQDLSDLDWHHRDPFDRALISQARCEQMAIMTNDSHFPKYGCHCLWD